ncbi:CamS family sex pheromone protein [Falsibacillus albus]|uniref:CamS family sex pheromone protein n=1 Tax=Falsibacillus albus TaxID=2478915 RepID=A0A3L7K3A2_9BACI|nr:CamS family sex pheromone protein [Falsibacillus albus]RLQ96481.1 CamS family sex pheromone protein [Falsibacillus albus]
MKKWLAVTFAAALLLTGCAPKFEKNNEVVQKTDDKTEKAFIPNYQISNKYYRTILPFKPSKTRGMVVANLNSRYDIKEFETGLMRIAKNEYSPDKYLFQEGQILDKDTVTLWLNRKYSKSQLKEEGLKASQNIGLNPLDDEKGTVKQRNEKNPIYLSHILEQDYLVKTDKDTVKLGGVMIGLALNSVHYYQKEQYGDVYEAPIKHADVVAEGKKIAAEVAKRLRDKPELKGVPITIGLFEQASKNSVVPGHFFSYSNVPANSTSLGSWKDVKENYYLFPSDEAKQDHRDDWTYFMNFKQDVEKYFSSNGVIGRAYYKDDQMSELRIEIPIQFYGEAEAIGFTQYVAGLIMDHFPDYLSIEVNVTSVNGPEALISKKPNEKEPYVHIYK